MGTLGQVLAAVLGLVTALVPVLVATDAFDAGGGSDKIIRVLPTQPPTQPTTQPTTAPTSPTSSSSEPVDGDIVLTVSDQLTEGALEERIDVVLEGSKVASLYASIDDPTVTQQVTATTPGNYDYVLDGRIAWLDDYGVRQEASASGHGSVYVDDGMRLDVYVQFESGGGMSLSLRSAKQS
ncbi:hypothetical protein [Kribbella jiaozuonensis]|uniref:Uncharacterized protein n=1 Tax=Kribbella jiaozuonensis TaxID=2575441 RepID=A0A4U3M3H0_9ACTN|nr:hypothetical protein [Kribbella jiaozuonensis]TKK82364.1 hypothetical protein FDA38_06140 [Kribbella jiaozuonensis]